MTETGITITLDAASFGAARAKLEHLVTFDPSQLMEEIAALGESQTRRRLVDEKRAPDGTPWLPNRAGTPILVETGRHLLGSVASYANAEEAVWGAAWEFAHVHQEGAIITAKNHPYLTFFAGGQVRRTKSVTIPARPFIGLSAENREEIEYLVSDHFGRLQ